MSANLRMKPKQTDGSIIQVLNPKGEVVQEISSGGGEGGGTINAGTVEVDFGAFPGKSDVEASVTGQTSITASSVVIVSISNIATTDHNADEHSIETIRAQVIAITAGTGFTIRVSNTSQLSEPVGVLRGNTSGGKGSRIYGKWNVNWIWI